MYPNLLADARLYALLLKFDQDLFALARKDGCPCGGALHSASYPRKPRGAQAALPEGYDRRHSCCCAEDGCRRRLTPPSVRYLGRKVYLGIVVVVVTAMRHGVTGTRGAALAAEVGASRETLARWRRWWTEAFPATAFWQRARGMLHMPVAEEELPASLLARLDVADAMTRVVSFLDFIKPVTTLANGNWGRFSMVD